MGRLALVAAVSVGLLFGSAGVAQADEQAFLDQIPPRNYISMWATDAGRLGQGYQICTAIKTGTPPHVIAESYRWDDGWAWVSAAQRELCPDTLAAGADAPASPPAEPVEPAN